MEILAEDDVVPETSVDAGVLIKRMDGGLHDHLLPDSKTLWIAC